MLEDRNLTEELVGKEDRRDEDGEAADDVRLPLPQLLAQHPSSASSATATRSSRSGRRSSVDDFVARASGHPGAGVRRAQARAAGARRAGDDGDLERAAGHAGDAAGARSSPTASEP